MAGKEEEPVRTITLDERVDLLNSLVDSNPEAGIPLEVPTFRPDEPQIDHPVEK